MRRAAGALLAAAVLSAAGCHMIAGSAESSVDPAPTPAPTMPPPAAPQAVWQTEGFLLHTFAEDTPGEPPGGFITDRMARGEGALWTVGEATGGARYLRAEAAADGCHAALLERSPRISRIDMRVIVDWDPAREPCGAAGLLFHGRGTAGDGYALAVTRGGRVELQRLVACRATVLAAIDAPPPVMPDGGWLLELHAENDRDGSVLIRARANGILLPEARDRAHPATGQTGLYVNGAGTAHFREFAVRQSAPSRGGAGS